MEGWHFYYAGSVDEDCVLIEVSNDDHTGIVELMPISGKTVLRIYPCGEILDIPTDFLKKVIDRANIEFRQSNHLLAFEIEPKAKISYGELVQMTSVAAMRDKRDFKLSFNGQTFLFYPLLPILELAKYCQGWLENPDADFTYSTGDGCKKPILAFYRMETGRKLNGEPRFGLQLKSAWQEFECEENFTENDVVNFARDLIAHVTSE